MKRLVPLPRESVEHLKGDKETGIGYQVVSVQLKDGRHFDQAVASEGCIHCRSGIPRRSVRAR